MLQIIYASAATKDLIQSEEIDRLISKAVANNSKYNITGVLLYRSGIFIQLLEGDPESVEATFAKIKIDSRHSNVTEVARILNGSRIFPEWSMALKKIDDSFDLTIINEVLYWNRKISESKKITNQQIIQMLSFFREKIDGEMITNIQDD